MRLLLDSIISSSDNGTFIHIMYDQHTTKVGSINSMEEYIKLHFLYEKDYDIKLEFKSYDSDAANAFHIQAADYVANAIYIHYEYNNSDYYNIYQPVFNKKSLFPYKTFGI